MHHRTAQLLLTASALLLSSCASQTTTDTRAAEAAIRALDEQWSATAGKGDLHGTVAFYGDDAALLPPNEPLAADRNAIRASWAGLLEQTAALQWKASKVEVAKSGELGYLYGTYRLAMKGPAGKPGAVDTGKLVEIWKKQPDGAWKCIVDTFNSDVPQPAAPQAK